MKKKILEYLSNQKKESMHDYVKALDNGDVNLTQFYLGKHSAFNEAIYEIKNNLI